MSLYNMLFGQNANADMLLGVLGLTRADVGRYRDCYIEGDHIVVHTRNGGGNREDYQDVFDALSDHPQYVRDEDDDFDCTYANLYFAFPPEFSADLIALRDSAPDVKPSDKWTALFEALKADTTRAR